MLGRLIRHLRAFRDDTRGSVTVEFALMAPLLFWTYCGGYAFFDAYRQSAVNLKAAYTIADLISRETRALNDTYIDSMYSMTQLLTRTNSPLSMRITVVRWDADTDRYHFDWSEARGGGIGAMTNDDMLQIENRLPVMPDEERVILVETWNTWHPPFQIGIGTTVLDNFVFTRPRFAPQVIFSNT